MNNLRQLGPKLPKITQLNAVLQSKNLSETTPNSIQHTLPSLAKKKSPDCPEQCVENPSTAKISSDCLEKSFEKPSPAKEKTDCLDKSVEKPENVIVIFGPETKEECVKNKSMAEKLKTKVENKPECVSKPEPVKPEVIEPKEVPKPQPEPKPTCEPKPIETPFLSTHICDSDNVRRDVFKQVVNEQMFIKKSKISHQQLATKKVDQKNYSSSVKSISTFARIEQTLTKMLATAIFGFIAYCTLVYGNLGLGIGNGKESTPGGQDGSKESPPKESADSE